MDDLRLRCLLADLVLAQCGVERLLLGGSSSGVEYAASREALGRVSRYILEPPQESEEEPTPSAQRQGSD